jgi:hypothetical protein
MRSAIRGALAALVLLSVIAVGQAQTGQTTGHVLLAPADLKWGPAPAGLPPGGQAVVLSGDPSKPEPFALSAKLPDGYTIPPHWHPSTENVVVVSGSLMLGMGEKLNEASMKTIGSGGYAMLPKDMRHYAKAKGATTIVVYGTGPFEITYVNPSDDPRMKK